VKALEITPVILSGGSGTRLWPLSREDYPKQFLNLAGAQSMLQQTADRCRQAGLQPPVYVCAKEHRFVVGEQIRGNGFDIDAILLEPMARNTAPAIAAACLYLAERSPDQLVLVLPADHVIERVDRWAEAVAQAAIAAANGALVTFGIEPTHAETGYGYIRKGEGLDKAPGTFKVAEFVEKPPAELATRFLSAGTHLWNSGMFLFRASRFLDELERLEPQLLAAVRASVAARAEDLDFVRLGPDGFATATAISVDDAVFARTPHAAVVPCSIGWNDVGSWKALHDVVAKDEQGNFTQGDVILRGCSDCYVRTEGTLTAVVGLDDVVVVATSDAILVGRRDRLQQVKDVVQQLKAAGRPEAVQQPRVYRPWGFYQTVHEGDRFQVKRLSIKPGHKISLQKHFHRAEHWVVVNGTAVVTRDGEETIVRENESIYLPLGCVHRLENPGKVPLNLIEVQSGAYLGEDDIVRFEDSYGRA
jgi:mannose-1-phosphate guanylyltransferase/mannose-6-phosphate isomerase